MQPADDAIIATDGGSADGTASGSATANTAITGARVITISLYMAATYIMADKITLLPEWP